MELKNAGQILLAFQQAGNLLAIMYRGGWDRLKDLPADTVHKVVVDYSTYLNSLHGFLKHTVPAIERELEVTRQESDEMWDENHNLLGRIKYLERQLEQYHISMIGRANPRGDMETQFYWKGERG